MARGWRQVSSLFFWAACIAGGQSALADQAEYDRNYGMAMTNVQAAHDAGYTGKGVTIAVLDSMVRTTHSGIQTGSGSKVLIQKEFLTDPGVDHHATHIAGIIASNEDGVGNVGYAPDVDLLNGVIFGSGGRSADPHGAVYWAVTETNARILNNSWGMVYPDNTTIQITDFPSGSVEMMVDLSVYRTIVQYDKIAVFAAGNSGLSEVGIEAGLPLYFSDLQPNWIVVVAVDENGKMPAYSNRCGLSAAWCIAAPGGSPDEKVYSMIALGDDDYGYMYGTSMAAPVVSAGLAVIAERYPFLTGSQLIEIVLGTADTSNDTSVTGEDYEKIYGHGVLDIGTAFKGPEEIFSDWTVNTAGYTQTFENDIFGNHAFTKTGSGTLYFTGNNTYTGQTTVSGGSLLLDSGSIAGDVLVSSGATFGGTGSVGQALTNNGSVYLDQTLSVDSYRQSSGAQLVLGTTSANLVVAQSADLAGKVLLKTSFAPGTYTFLTASSISGTYTVDPGEYAFINPVLNQTATSVSITLSAANSFASLEGMSKNESTVAEALDQLKGTGAANTQISVLEAASQAEAHQAFAEIGGTVTANMLQSTVSRAGAIQGVVYRKLSGQNKILAQNRNQRPGRMAQGTTYTTDVPLYRYGSRARSYQPVREPSKYAPSAWGEFIYGNAEYKKDKSTGKVEDQIMGGVLGTDGYVTRNTKVGLLLSYMNEEVTESRANGKIDADNFMAGLYLGSTHTWFEVYGMLSAFYQKNDSERKFTLLNQQAKGSFDSYGVLLDLEPALRFRLGERTYGRLAVGATGGYYSQDSYKEKGDAGSLMLNVKSTSEPVLEMRVGGSIDGVTGSGHIGWNLQSYVKYRAIGNSPETEMEFQSSGVRFKVEAADRADVVLNVGGGLSYALNSNLDIGAQGAIDVGDDEFAYTVGGYLKYRF